MRLALVLQQPLAPVPGGTGRYSVELGAALAATAPGGANVIGWTAWHRDISAARVPGVAGPHRLPLGRRSLAAAWERGRGPRPVGADMVHAPTLLMPPRGRRPLAVTIHDAVPWTHPETLTPRGVAFHRRMAARAEREADLVAVPTAAVADELAGVLDLGERVRVVPLGVTAALQAPAEPAASRRAAALRLPAEGYLLTLATLEPRKGLDVALAALAQASCRLPLLVVGSPGWGGVDPAALARQLGLPADRVRVLGWVTDPDLAVVLTRATALLAPSRAEGFGLPVLEAMASGTPVISSDCGALAEVGAQATVRVPVGDAPALAAAIDAVTADPERQAAMAAAGRMRAADFSWTSTASLMWREFERVGASG